MPKTALYIALQELGERMREAAEEHLPKAYATGKGYAAAKSGHQISAGRRDADIAARSMQFNDEKLTAMLANLDRDILSIDPAAYASIDEYLAEIDRIFDAYAGRANAYVYYAEQSYLDGFMQGGMEVRDELATDYGVTPQETGFYWRTAADEKVCPTCEALDGEWFPLAEGELALSWQSHIG